MSKRLIATTPGAKDEVVEAIEQLSDACVSGLLMLLEVLENPDPAVQPDIEERCGMLTENARSFEVYALPLPGCRAFRLAISVPADDVLSGPITMHGPVRSTSNSSGVAADLAARHLKLVNPVWEPAHET